jgi:Pentapeptide repeats (8 copies)
VINRHVWRHLLEEFAKTCLDPEGSGTLGDLRNHLEKLEKNQRSTSYLLQQGSFKQHLDFSDTFYPDLQAPAVTFTDCNFSSSLLHYSNFHRAKFDRCDFSGCILIGSYLEAATFKEVRVTHNVVDYVVDYSARYHGEGGHDPSTMPRSFIREAEQGWRGHWTEHADHVETTSREFEAKWHNPSDKTKIKATIALEGEADGRFVRTKSDDRNDGIYEPIAPERWFMLDTKRSVALVGGTRTLQSRVPSVWWAIWWQQLRSRPMQILPITDAEERQRGH